MSEAEFQKMVIELAALNHWAVAHFKRVLIQGRGKPYYATPVAADGAGWPDLVLIKGSKVIFAELKADGGRLEPAQALWRDRLTEAGQEWRLWRPRMWNSIVEELTDG